MFLIFYLANNSLTRVEIILPSALPPSCLVATPITLPISAGDVAPTSVIIFATNSLISDSDN